MQDRLFLGDLVESQTAAINIIEKENKDQELNARRQPSVILKVLQPWPIQKEKKGNVCWREVFSCTFSVEGGYWNICSCSLVQTYR